MAFQEKSICIFTPSFDEGGVERMLVNLAKGFHMQGLSVHLITGNPASPYLNSLPSQIVRGTASRVNNDLLQDFSDYLSHQKPSWVLTAKDQANKIALLARRRSGTKTQLAFRVGTTASVKARASFVFPPKRWIKLFTLRNLYRKCDLIIAVSKGVAKDLSKITGLGSTQIRVIQNPVVTDEFHSMARVPIGHPWFQEHEKPVILAAGGFRRAKDFPTLIRAFARICERLPSRLVILGRGRQEKHMKQVARELGVIQDISFPGFIPNPYPYMAQADVFVLSSRWEGSPNVLVEALALGTPVVSTDCRSGPREILDGGKYGKLVPVGDANRLAEAVAQTLENPQNKDQLKKAADPYGMENSAKSYMEAMEITQKNSPSRS